MPAPKAGAVGGGTGDIGGRKWVNGSVHCKTEIMNNFLWNYEQLFNQSVYIKGKNNKS